MRVAIIGGGVVGLFGAHFLRQAGAEVVLVDRGKVGGGCSSGNAGWVCPSISFPLPAPGLTATSLRWLLRSDSPLHIKPGALLRLAPWLWKFRGFCNQSDFERGAHALAALAENTLLLYQAILDDGIDFEHRRSGLLFVFHREAGIAAELEMLRLTGYEDRVRALSPEAVARHEPALAEGVAGGLLAEPEWHVKPESLCAAIAAKLRDRHVDLHEDVSVESIRTADGRAESLKTSAGDIEADAYVVCTGAEAGRLAAQAGCPLFLQAGKGYSITIAPPPVTVHTPLYFVETKLAVSPYPGAVRIAGTMELAGINLDMNIKRVAALEAAADRELPGILEGERGRPWVGMRPITPDGLPSIGRLPTCENVYVATGHQMLGVTLAPSTGHTLAELLTTGSTTVDLEPFRPDRFN